MGPGFESLKVHQETVFFLFAFSWSELNLETVDLVLNLHKAQKVSHERAAIVNKHQQGEPIQGKIPCFICTFMLNHQSQCDWWNEYCKQYSFCWYRQAKLGGSALLSMQLTLNHVGSRRVRRRVRSLKVHCIGFADVEKQVFFLFCYLSLEGD